MVVVCYFCFYKVWCGEEAANYRYGIGTLNVDVHALVILFPA